MKYKIIQNNLISCLIAVVLTVIICIITYGHFVSQSMILQAENQAYILKEICQNSTNAVEELNKLKNGFKSRVTLISYDGVVLFDSVYDEQTQDNHLERKEIKQALENLKGSSQRVSSVDKKNNYYFALNIENVGIIRVGVSSDIFVISQIFSNLPIIVIATIVILVLLYWISEKTTKRIVNTIENYNFDAVDKCGYDELSHFIKKIEGEKEKLSSVFSSMQECIIVCDTDKKIIQANRKAKEIFNIKENERLTRLGDSREINSQMDKAFDNRVSHGVVKNNKCFYQYTVSPNIQNGKNNGAIIIFLDVTEQFHSQKLRREFTANVTHELKTPLTSILGYSQLIASGIAKQEDISKFGQIIEKNAKLLLTLIDDIMEISNLEENGINNLTLVDMKQVITEITKDLLPIMQDKNIVFDSSVDSIIIKANHKQMCDIYRNLLSNAIKYNKIGGMIFTSLKCVDNTVVLSVKDSGIGISQSDLSKVFQRFFVVDKSRNKNISSTGLGLSIVKHIAEAMGGSVDVKSILGEGSEFIVKLPLDVEKTN